MKNDLAFSFPIISRSSISGLEGLCIKITSLVIETGICKIKFSIGTFKWQGREENENEN